MATGYRLVLRDVQPGVPFHGRDITNDYLGLQDNVVTPPSSTISDAAGIVVSKNFFRTAFLSHFGHSVEGTPRVSLLEATWDEADVVETINTGSAIQSGTAVHGVFEPDPPVELVYYRVSDVVTGDELTAEEIQVAALDITLQVA